MTSFADQPASAPTYGENDSLAAMRADCEATHRELRRAARLATRPAPSIRYEDQPREQRKPQIEISEAAARLAGALHFHLE